MKVSELHTRAESTCYRSPLVVTARFAALEKEMKSQPKQSLQQPVPPTKPKFGEGHPQYFKISADGRTATRNGQKWDEWKFVCISPSFDSGKLYAPGIIQRPPLRLLCLHVGAHECKLKVLHESAVQLGIIPVSRATEDVHGSTVGQFLSLPYGIFWGVAKHGVKTNVTCKKGDFVTMQLDLDANTLTYLKNGSRIASPVNITHEPYYFALNAYGGAFRDGSVEIM